VHVDRRDVEVVQVVVLVNVEVKTVVDFINVKVEKEILLALIRSLSFSLVENNVEFAQVVTASKTNRQRTSKRIFFLNQQDLILICVFVPNETVTDTQKCFAHIYTQNG
jgi:hypothetical protein